MSREKQKLKTFVERNNYINDQREKFEMAKYFIV